MQRSAEEHSAGFTPDFTTIRNLQTDGTGMHVNIELIYRREEELAFKVNGRKKREEGDISKDGESKHSGLSQTDRSGAAICSCFGRDRRTLNRVWPDDLRSLAGRCLLRRSNRDFKTSKRICKSILYLTGTQ